MPRGGDRGGRKPKLPPEFERVKLSGVRIQGWLYAWLKEQPESAGKLVEKALIEYYELTPPDKKKE